MKNHRRATLFLRLLCLLAAVMLLPVSGLCEDGSVEVEDMDIPEIPGTESVPREPLLPIDFSIGGALNPEGFSESADENGNPVRIYEDSTIRVVITQTVYAPTKKKGADVWLADITISDVSQLRTASFDDHYDFASKSRTGRILELAQRVNAVVAMNGDSWGAKSEKHNFGVVFRQGRLIESRLDSKGNYRMDLLLIDEDGDFHGIHAAQEGDLDDPSVFEGKKILDVFSFGPIIVEDGAAVEDYQGTDRSKNGSWMYMKSEEPAQRIAICQLGPLHYLIAVSDNEHERGLTLRQMADFLVTQGVQFAYNMDGGVSSFLYFSGVGKVNASWQKQGRNLWDIIYFASAESPVQDQR